MFSAGAGVFFPEPEFFFPEPEPEVKNPEFAQHYAVSSIYFQILEKHLQTTSKLQNTIFFSLLQQFVIIFVIKFYFLVSFVSHSIFYTWTLMHGHYISTFLNQQKSIVFNYSITYQFRENASNAPNINRCGIIPTAQENFWCTIPQRYNFMGVCSYWYAKCSC